MAHSIKYIALAAVIALITSQAFAGLDWSYGALTNADGLSRSANSIAYSPNGNVFVAGVEKNTTGNTLIVTKKFSPAGVLLASVTNTYLIGLGTTVNDG